MLPVIFTLVRFMLYSVKIKKKCNLKKNVNFVVVYAFAIPPYVNSVTSFYCLEIEQILESIDKRKFAIAQFIVVFPL